MKFKTIHNNNVHELGTANQLYIFGIAIELSIEQKLHIDIQTFITFVNDCHGEDCFNAPLKPFTVFIANWWKELQERDKRFIVNKFYEVHNGY